jgi:tRNA (cmo5U34)-methyltransferase
MSKMIGKIRQEANEAYSRKFQSYSSSVEWSKSQHAKAYLDIIDNIPHRIEGEMVLLEHVPVGVKRVLDIGTGNGRLLSIIKINRPRIKDAIGVDISPTMLKTAEERFISDRSVKVFRHDLNEKLLESRLGKFDAIVTSLTIHHLSHKRKRSIYEEIFHLLNHEGIFCDLEHVNSPTQNLREHFLALVGAKIASFVRQEHSDKLLAMETQLRWLRNIGFIDVDCYWKWLELALMIGIKP